MIQEEYVTFETAKLLKKAGFPQDDRAKAYDHDGWMFAHGDECDGEFFTTPTQAQAMRWMREEKEVSVRVNYSLSYQDWFYDLLNFIIEEYHEYDEHWGTYEAASEAGIQAACRYLIEEGGGNGM